MIQLVVAIGYQNFSKPETRCRHWIWEYPLTFQTILWEYPVCCSVLQSATVSCSVLQYVAENIRWRFKSFSENIPSTFSYPMVTTSFEFWDILISNGNNEFLNSDTRRRLWQDFSKSDVVFFLHSTFNSELPLEITCCNLPDESYVVLFVFWHSTFVP